MYIPTETKYKALVQDGTWNAPSKEGEQIIALTAKIERMQRAKAGQEPQPKLDKKKGKPKKDPKTKPKKLGDSKWAWKEVPPKEGKPKQKKVGDKTYHFCPHYKAWTLHALEDCMKDISKGQKLQVPAGKSLVSLSTLVDMQE